jgi:hypothetical protein
MGCQVPFFGAENAAPLLPWLRSGIDANVNREHTPAGEDWQQGLSGSGTWLLALYRGRIDPLRLDLPGWPLRAGQECL